MNKKLRLEILKRFRTQREFADEIDVAESVISDVIHGRRAISESAGKVWQAALKCNERILWEIVRR
jgi:predicted transcriptional regulator